MSEEPVEPDVVADFHARRDRIRGELGGAARVERLHARGERTIREHIGALLDDGSFDEVGTFVHSLRPEDKDDTPGDGKIGGHGTVDGRAVTVAGDDITVKRGSSSPMGSRRLGRLFAHAERCGHPIVYFGATGGARIPDSLGSAGFAQVAVDVDLFRRRRRVPFITVIVGDSFGGSSFVSAASDLVIQVRGTCLAVTSPLVAKIATGEDLTNDELGGADVHAKRTGQIDLVAEDYDEAYALIRRALALLPANARERAPKAPTDGLPIVADPDLEAVVPRRRARAYDVHRVLDRVLDGDSLLELGAGYGRGLVCGLGRLDGHTVGVVASQPKFFAGSLDPRACEKAVKLLCLTDAYDIPVLFFQDVPGFFVGKQVEHDGMLKHAIRLQTALALSASPKLTTVLRKAYGLAYFSLGGNDSGVDTVYAWPSAEISFMDPLVAANVVAGGDDAAREEAAQAMRADIDPYGAAGLMKVDEVIDPADTRATLARALHRLERRPTSDGSLRPLASWPTC
ncbi:Methylmalonyl-CoA carboxyltransferase 12S subunit [Baekduia alba]|uniref:acyl-CoA carboxylase subunit beta n=1 Tax=Baekduia alba TaxID=2997333 RepID=UPI00234164A1|nr:carboxyl transferase domain-containing protein [Baekduia alba]WCB92993.1 Methylmalonyl-CoA carboxyltransferase 12S subunit [Baekduia alba]